MFKDVILKFLKLEGLINNLTGYLETRVELLKIEVREDVAKLLSKTIVGLLLAFVLFFFLILLSFALSYYIGTLVGVVGGFLIVSSFYLLIGVLVFIFRHDIISNIEKRLVEMKKPKNM